MNTFDDMFGDMLTAWLSMENTLNKQDADTCKVLAFMTIDYVAAKSGMSTSEFLGKYSPIMEKANSELGGMQI